MHSLVKLTDDIPLIMALGSLIAVTICISIVIGITQDQKVIKHLQNPHFSEKSLILNETIKFLNRLKSADQISILKVAGKVAIIIISAMLISIFISSRFDQSNQALTRNTENLKSETSASNLKSRLMIAETNGDTENASNDNFYNDKIEIDKNNPKVNIPEEQNSTEIEEAEINFKSDDTIEIHTADNDQIIPVESKSFDENAKDTLSENIFENEAQTESKNKEIITQIDPVDFEIATFNENTESKGEIPEVDLQGKTTAENKKFRKIDSTATSVKEKDQKSTANSDDQFLTFAEQKFYIFFKQNSADLDNQAFEQLDNIVENVSKNTSSDIVIEGYADSYGDKDFNKKLSIFRANIVEGYFVAKGVHSSRLKVVGLGSDSPIGDNSTKEGRQKNRRVEIKIFTKSNKDQSI